MLFINVKYIKLNGTSGRGGELFPFGKTSCQSQGLTFNIYDFVFNSPGGKG